MSGNKKITSKQSDFEKIIARRGIEIPKDRELETLINLVSDQDLRIDQLVSVNQTLITHMTILISRVVDLQSEMRSGFSSCQKKLNNLQATTCLLLGNRSSIPNSDRKSDSEE